MPGTDCNYYRSDIDFWLPVVEKGSWKNEKLQKLKKRETPKLEKSPNISILGLTM